MRLTSSLNHVQRYFWGKGWGQKPGRDKTAFNFKIQWKAKSKRKIFECIQTLPPDVTVEDANQFVKNSLHQEFNPKSSIDFKEKVNPWPHSRRPLRGFSSKSLIN